jgi:hypothetical protein
LQRNSLREEDNGEPVDVEVMMERRRQAQIEAEALIKKEKERRALEEKERAIQNEAAELGLPRLIAIRGAVRPRAVMVECKTASLNLNCHFILETENHMFHFKPPKADIMKLKFAVKTIANLRKERLRKIKVVSMKKYDEDQPEFWAALGGGGPADVKELEQKESDWESLYESQTRFYRSDKDVGLLPENDLQSTDLDSASSFVVVAPGEFYIWFGKNVGLNQKKTTEQKAVEDIGWECERWVRLHIVTEGKEPYLFQEKFQSFELAQEVANSTPTTARKKVSEAQIMKMLAFDPDLVPVVDDVYGQVEVWLIADYTKIPVAANMKGKFYNRSSYIVLYTGQRDTVLYFWQGSESTTLWSHARDEIIEIQQESIKNSRKIDKVPIIRLIEGDEPPHFLGIFQGKMVVLNGMANDFGGVRYLTMLHTRGFNLFNTRTVECSPTPSLLDSDDAFIIHDTKTRFVWKGKHVSNFAFEIAQENAKNLHGTAASKTIIVNEDLEPPTFWKVLGGKKEHIQHRAIPEGCPPDRIKPRLFVYSKRNVVGKSAVLFSHLRPHDQVIIDVWDKVYVWSGKFSPSKDSFFALQVAQTYLKKGCRTKDTSGKELRETDDMIEGEPVPIMEVKDNKEPLEFIKYFHGWRYSDEKVAESMSKEATEVAKVVSQYTKYYTLEELQHRSALPLTMNLNKLEQYMDEVEFVSVFGMPKAAWYQQPAWKRTEQKKEKGLF